jgi:hypothetical protein
MARSDSIISDVARIYGLGDRKEGKRIVVRRFRRSTSAKRFCSTEIYTHVMQKNIETVTIPLDNLLTSGTGNDPANQLQ